MKARSVDHVLRIRDAYVDGATEERMERSDRRDRLIRQVFAPMPYLPCAHRVQTKRRPARPEWHFVLVASLMAHGWSRSQLAERYGGSAHTWSARIAEARRRGLLTERSALTAYGALLEPEVLERVR